ncbi:putative frag1 dram sfk1 family protein [Cladorrhinum samala]|uniref:Frag1 dram sfk1 family protein n=1 Tax=Cladorrhinum samala TaxID=585594 RepID=A0AAV9HGE8_9PEZI|nr:putative frag1 dram sfk1 family protein [Cladorrhinum samala]
MDFKVSKMRYLRPSWWIFPILAGVIWLATLLALLLFWLLDSPKRRHYSSMDERQKIAYISDVGAAELKPLFVTGCVLTTVFLDISFLADRWLRHKGRLVPNITTGEKILSGLTIVFAVIGTAGLILLSIFDTARHPKLHDIFLLLFIAGYVLSAIFICWEYQKLGQHYRSHRILRTSFYTKLFFVIIEILLAIAFVACTFTKHYNPGAVFEWVIAFIFSAYVFSFYVDLYPAVKTKGRAGFKEKGMPGSMSDPESSRYGSGTDMEEGRIAGSGEHLTRPERARRDRNETARPEVLQASNF